MSSKSRLKTNKQHCWSVKNNALREQGERCGKKILDEDSNSLARRLESNVRHDVPHCPKLNP